MYDSCKAVLASTALTRIGDGLQIIIPLAALIMAIYNKDWEGCKYWLACTLITALISHTLKGIADYTPLGIRPNDKHGSFPSAHTSSAFSGATFILHRYGLEPGIPAFLGAILVGVTRIEGHFHHPHDVYAGILISWAVSYCLTAAFNRDQASVTPLPVA